MQKCGFNSWWLRRAIPSLQGPLYIENDQRSTVGHKSHERLGCNGSTDRALPVAGVTCLPLVTAPCTPRGNTSIAGCEFSRVGGKWQKCLCLSPVNGLWPMWRFWLYFFTSAEMSIRESISGGGWRLLWHFLLWAWRLRTMMAAGDTHRGQQWS